MLTARSRATLHGVIAVELTVGPRVGSRCWRLAVVNHINSVLSLSLVLVSFKDPVMFQTKITDIICANFMRQGHVRSGHSVNRKTVGGLLSKFQKLLHRIFHCFEIFDIKARFS